MITAQLAAVSFRNAVPADSTTVTLTVLPNDIGWIVEEDIARSITRSGGRMVGAQAKIRAEFGILDLRVSYENMRRDHLFGARKVDRTVSVTLHSRITDTLRTEPLLSEDLSRSIKDTVLVSDLDRLEASTIRATRGILPSEGFFENLTEPLIVLGTVAVAVVLLFTVRS